jgi:hypothetical protein
MNKRVSIKDAITKPDPNHGGISFLDALKGAAEKQRELEAKFGKPPKGHVSITEFERAIAAAERLAKG